MDGRRLAAVVLRGGAEQNPAYRPAHPPCVPERAVVMVADGPHAPGCVRALGRRQQCCRVGCRLVASESLQRCVMP